jgi:uncharacterized repeat protein (TIGR03803 family)
MCGLACSVTFAETGTTASGAGSFNVLHSFGTVMDDGEAPWGSLIVSGRTFYGMTAYGGANGYGAIFEFNTKTGQDTVLYSFKGYSENDGEYPEGSLILSGRTLYGMTSEGGPNDYGTIFEFNTKTGQYTVLHSFGTVTGDGETPYGSLVLSGKTLYGMTGDGGATNNGTIFSFNTKTGQYTVLYSFKGGTEDGGTPYGSLVVSGKNLYGMTGNGGANTEGTIFSFNTKTGQCAVLHSFGSVTGDGSNPYYGDNLILSGKTLYGMTTDGGTDDDGAIFSFNTKTGQYTVLHSFTGATTDGSVPYGSLILSGKHFYGMTENGGADDDGVLFSFSLK